MTWTGSSNTSFGLLNPTEGEGDRKWVRWSKQGGGWVIVRFFPTLLYTYTLYTPYTLTHTHVEGCKGLKNRKHPLEEASSSFHFFTLLLLFLLQLPQRFLLPFESQRGQICKWGECNGGGLRQGLAIGLAGRVHFPPAEPLQLRSTQLVN